MERNKSNSGFTIVEMLIYVTILVLAVGVVSAVLVWMVRSSSAVQTRNELTAGLEHALSLMSNEIREAQSIYTPTTNSSQLSLYTQSDVPDQEVGTYVDFFLCGTRLCIKREFQSPQALTADRLEIQNLIFTQIDTGGKSSVHIELTAAKEDFAQTVNTTISLRSY